MKQIKLTSDELKEIFIKGEVTVGNLKITCYDPVEYGDDKFLRKYLLFKTEEEIRKRINDMPKPQRTELGLGWRQALEWVLGGKNGK